MKYYITIDNRRSKEANNIRRIEYLEKYGVKQIEDYDDIPDLVWSSDVTVEIIIAAGYIEPPKHAEIYSNILSLYKK